MLGIGGMVLHSKRKKSGLETRFWVWILLSDLEFMKKLSSIHNAETGLVILGKGLSKDFAF